MSRAPRARLVRGALIALAAVGVVAGVYVLATVPPTDASFYPRCQFHSLTGLHCPGCGTTRAVHALLNGRVEQALAYNAFAFLVLPVLGLSLLRSVWHWAWDGDRPEPRWVAAVWRWAPAVLAVVAVTFWLARNVPAYPFTLLAPHELER